MVIAFIIWSIAFFLFYAYSRQCFLSENVEAKVELIRGQCSRFIAKRTFNCLMLTLNSLRSHWKCSNWKAQTDSDSIMSLFSVTIMWVWPMWLVCKSLTGFSPGLVLSITPPSRLMNRTAVIYVAISIFILQIKNKDLSLKLSHWAILVFVIWNRFSPFLWYFEHFNGWSEDASTF